MDYSEPIKILGFVEAFELSGAIGWAIAPGLTEPQKLKLLIDGRVIKTFECSLIRHDVAATRDDLFPGEDGSRAGFSVDIPSIYIDGQRHTYDFLHESGSPVDLIAINRCAASPGEFCIPPRPVLGRIYSVQGTSIIRERAVLVDKPGCAPRVGNEVEATDTCGKVLSLTADTPRSDIEEKLRCSATCGFDIVMPDDIIEESDTQLHAVLRPERLPIEGSSVFKGGVVSGVGPLVTTGDDDASTSEFTSDLRQHALGSEVEDFDDPRLEFSAFPRSLLFEIGTRLATIRRQVTPIEPAPPAHAYTGDVECTIAGHFDPDYYLKVYKDVRIAKADPLIHFVLGGWREGRRPNSWFDTAYYLEANPDVREAGVNPLWHYLVVGRREGRRIVRVGGRRREVLESVVDPREKSRDYHRPDVESIVAYEKLKSVIRTVALKSRGIALSLSQDCYVDTLGGIQLFVSDEQKSFSRRECAYVHLSPLDPDLVLAAPSSRPYYKVVVDGGYIGVTSHDDVRNALGELESSVASSRTFICHCLLGHNIGRVIELFEAFRPDRNAFWIHDFSSICSGYTLLRNDIEFCGAPNVDSNSCRVCVYGDTRRTHVKQFESLFQRISFSVIAPSRSALEIWLRSTDVPYQRAVVHSHCVLAQTANKACANVGQACGTTEHPLRIAFVGFPASHKGWPAFEELTSRVAHLACYKFFHFCSGDVNASLTADVERISVRTTIEHRDAVTQALSANSIDLAMILAPWPETFSYVTFEAMAAGVEVIALRDSGNVADTVLRLGRGIVVDGEAALIDLFTSHRVIEYVRLRQRQGITAGILTHNGTTATLRADAFEEAM